MTRIEILKEIVRQEGACDGIHCFIDACPLQGKCKGVTSDLALAKELLAEETSDDIDFLSENVRQEGYGEIEKYEAGDYVRYIKKTELEADSYFNPSMREMLDGEYRKILKTTESHDGSTARIDIEGIGAWFWHLSDLEFITADEYNSLYKKCDLKKDDPVEISFDGESFFRRGGEKFYDYDATLAKPFVILDRDGDLRNHKYCRKVRTDYEPYIEFDKDWIFKEVNCIFFGKKRIGTIIGKAFGSEVVIKIDEWCINVSLQKAFESITWADGRKFGKEVK